MTASTIPTSFTGALASPHGLATEAGLRVYRDGGTAIDAAITAAAVLTVVYPHNVALGGDLIALVRTPDGVVKCVNASGWAGANSDATVLRATYGRTLPVRGADSVTVPGGIRGWEALRRFGSRMPWEDTLLPAQEAAAGAPVAASLATHITHPENEDLFGTEDFDRVFRPNGRCLTAGEELKQPSLALTLGALRESGPDAFYTGELADRTVDYLRSRGSALAAGDLAAFQPEIVNPIQVSFRGLTVMTSPPNTHGFVLLRALRAIDELGVNDPLGDGLGTLMRIFLRGNQLRRMALGDPRHTAIDVHALLHGDLGGLAETDGETADSAPVPHGDTVGIAAADSDGYAVSLIQSVYHAFGSGLIDPETGILFHNRGTGFSLDATSPNVIAPRKRPAHTLMPTMTTQDGVLRHVLSTMGGQGQPQIIAQLLLRAVEGVGAEAATAAARAIVGRQTDGSTAETVSVETEMFADAREAIARSGLSLSALPAHAEELGQANVVFADADGSITAASDPRSDGAAVVVHYPRHR